MAAGRGPVADVASARARVDELLDLLERRRTCATGCPREMSGGQQQRVAIAVALANEPEVLFADEPTGELDEASSQLVFDALRDVNERLGVTVLIVTHDQRVSQQVRRTVQIRDGRLSTEVLRSSRLDEHGVEQPPRRGVRRARPGRPSAAAPRSTSPRCRCKDLVRLELETDHVKVHPTTSRGGAVVTGDRRAALRGPHPDLRRRADRRARPARTCRSRCAPGELLVLRGPLGVGQDDAAQPPRRARPADVRAGCGWATVR